MVEVPCVEEAREAGFERKNDREKHPRQRFNVQR